MKFELSVHHKVSWPVCRGQCLSETVVVDPCRLYLLSQLHKLHFITRLACLTVICVTGTELSKMLHVPGQVRAACMQNPTCFSTCHSPLVLTGLDFVELYL